MIRLAIAYIFVLTQPFAPNVAPSDAAPQSPPHIEIVAVHAKNEAQGEKNIEATIQGLHPILDALPYDTFQLAGRESKEAVVGQSVTLNLDGAYAVEVTPQEIQPEVVTASTRVIHQPDGRAAVKAGAELRTGKAVVVRGLPAEQGETILFIRLVPDETGRNAPSPNENKDQKQDKPKADDSSSEENSPQENEKQEKEQEEKNKEQQDKQDQAQNPKEEDNSQGRQPEKDMRDVEQPPQNQMQKPKGQQNIEAILRNLEEKDKREQNEQRKNRVGIRVDEKWW
jgi:hypothetical protein